MSSWKTNENFLSWCNDNSIEIDNEDYGLHREQKYLYILAVGVNHTHGFFAEEGLLRVLVNKNIEDGWDGSEILFIYDFRDDKQKSVVASTIKLVENKYVIDYYEE